MSSQITHTHTIINIHLLAHILDSCALIFSSCSLFAAYPNRINQYKLYSERTITEKEIRQRNRGKRQVHHVTASRPSPGDNYQSTGGKSKRTLGQAKMAA